MRFIVFSFFLLQACSQPDRAKSISFYYWKTTFRLTDAEKHVLQHNQVKKLYVRYFDVALRKGAAVPVSSITFHELPAMISVVPVVYIKNEVMLLPSLKVEELARRVVSYINQINAENSIQSSEMQIDCDWTIRSKEKYFAFIDAVKTLTDQKLSATIRLHQVKYWRKTGVPSVDRGILMYYNMSQLSAGASNSIYERESAQRYLASLKTYPLVLDVALPVFSWGIHSRNEKVIGILNKLDEEAFAHDDRFKSKAASIFEVKESGFNKGHYFQKGDQIKIESITEDDLMTMASDLSDYTLHKPGEIIFFDLDEFNLNHYEEADIFKDVCTVF